LDRVLFVYPSNLKKEYWSDKTINPTVTDNWSNILNKLLDIPYCEESASDPIVIQMDPDAEARLKAWQREKTDFVNKSENNHFKSIQAKMETYVGRFALILEMAFYACNSSN